MTEHRERVLRIERTFDAPVERVFEAWTSEEVLRRSLRAPASTRWWSRRTGSSSTGSGTTIPTSRS